MREAVRIALVARPAQGGIRSHLILLHRHLGTDFSPRVLAPASLLDTLPEAQSKNAMRLEISPRAHPSDFHVSNELLKMLEPHEIVHAHGIRAGWVAALARTRRAFPLVVTFHNVPPTTLIGKFAVASISRRADRCIAVSRAIASFLPSRKTHVIPNGIEVDRFAQGDHAEARALLGIKPNTFVVGCVARLSREKGIDILLAAASRAPEMHFVIVGDGPERAALERCASSNVRFLGRREDVAACMKAFDLLVIPSRSEGQGIVALEAFASGCPVIAANVGGLAESVQDGETGSLVTPNDPLALSDAITRLASDPHLRNALRANALTFVAQSGSVARMCRSVEEVYRETLGMRG